MMFSSVVLPPPLEPSSATCSPCFISNRSIPSTGNRRPPGSRYDFRMDSSNSDIRPLHAVLNVLYPGRHALSGGFNNPCPNFAWRQSFGGSVMQRAERHCPRRNVSKARQTSAASAIRLATNTASTVFRRGPARVTRRPQASGYGVYAEERQNLNPIFRFSRPKFETNGAMWYANR
jgi:hypothetical protein